MPTSRCLDVRLACLLVAAVAPPTARAAASMPAARIRAMRLDTQRLQFVRFQHPPQAVLEGHLRLPAQQLPGACDVGPALLRVVAPQPLEDDLARRAGDLLHELRELEQRPLVRIANVDRQVLA